MAHVGEFSDRLVNEFEPRLSLELSDPQRQQDIFFDRQLRDKAAVFRHVADTEGGAAWRGRAARSAPSNRTAPRLGFRCPMMERISVVLPAPLRPTRLTMLPWETRIEKPRSAGMDWISTTR